MVDSPGFAPRFEYSDLVRGADGVGGVVLGMSHCTEVTWVAYACFCFHATRRWSWKRYGTVGCGIYRTTGSRILRKQLPRVNQGWTVAVANSLTNVGSRMAPVLASTRVTAC